jgi:hypothetical protein
MGLVLMETSRLMANDSINNPLLLRTRHSLLEHAYVFASKGVPLFGLMIVVPTFLEGVLILVKVRLMQSVSLALELDG